MLVTVEGVAEPFNIELGHPWKPEPGKFIDLRTVETSALLFYLNPDVVLAVIKSQVIAAFPWPKKPRRSEVEVLVVMAVIKRIALELDRRLPQQWG